MRKVAVVLVGRVRRADRVLVNRGASASRPSGFEARFKEACLTKTERDIMLGSAPCILTGAQTELASIQDKLDWHLLNGRTYEEAKNDIPMISPESIISSRKFLAEAGLLKIPAASAEVIRHFPNVALNILIP